MDFDALLERFAAAAEAGDGSALAALFTADGVYHDGFYGAFEGREAIRTMLEERFHRDARDFKWELFEPLSSADLAYVRYRFSFTSKLAEAAGRRVVFEGMSCVHLEGGLIRRYEEVFDSGIAMAQLGFAPERAAKIHARMAEELRAKPESEAHLAA